MKKIFILVFVFLSVFSIVIAGRPTGTGEVTGTVSGSGSSRQSHTNQNNTGSRNSNAGGSYTESGGSSASFTSKVDLGQYCKERAEAIKNGAGLVKYDGGICDGIDKEGGYNALMETANQIIVWIRNIAFLIAAAVGFFAGFRYMASAADPAQRSKAKAMLINVVIGIVLIFTSWFIVDFILHTFVKGDTTGAYSGLEE